MQQKGYSKFAYFVAVMTKHVTAVFMMAAPLILLAILHQGGLGTVPIYNGNTGKALFYVNNVVAALSFCGVWFLLSALVFRYSKKIAGQLKEQRNAA